MAWWKRDGPDEALIRQHGDAVWRTVVRLLGSSSHDAADCFQQAFADLCERRRRGPIDCEAAMFKRIAIARAIDTVRRRVRDRRRRSDADVGLLPTTHRDPAEASELLNDLRDALAGLPELQASAFALTQIEDESHADAASALGVTANHIGVLVHRARAALRERLNSHRPLREARS